MLRQELAGPQGAFVASLEGHLRAMNDFFLEREETSVIKLEQLTAAGRVAGSRAACKAAYRALIDFHGARCPRVRSMLYLLGASARVDVFWKAAEVV